MKFITIGIVLILIFFVSVVWADPIIFDPQIAEKFGEIVLPGLDPDNTVYSYRVGGGVMTDKRGKITNPSSFGYVVGEPVTALGPVLKEVEVDKLLKLISKDHHYIFVNQPSLCCYQEPEIAFLFVAPNSGLTAVFMSRRCLQVAFTSSTKSVSLSPDSSAVALWDFVDTIFPPLGNITKNTRELSPLPESKLPYWHTDPQPVSGPSIHDMKINETLSLVVDYKLHTGRKTFDYYLNSDNRGPFLSPGKKLAEECDNSKRYDLNQIELTELQEFIKNCRWKTIEPEHYSPTIELEWSNESGVTHTEHYVWVESKQEGFSTFSFLWSVWDNWNSQE